MIVANDIIFVPNSFVGEIKKLESVKTPADTENRLVIISSPP
jgi:hypothetical protein